MERRESPNDGGGTTTTVARGRTVAAEVGRLDTTSSAPLQPPLDDRTGGGTETKTRAKNTKSAKRTRE
ncbi:MAG TPA: hypothetical protein PLM66_12315, partial [Candidatus Latescibacteria bacterium]|nr:hypothetical protein [Candidatus Latescibacterota bacterium]